jgi:hypothetical protein
MPAAAHPAEARKTTPRPGPHQPLPVRFSREDGTLHVVSPPWAPPSPNKQIPPLFDTSALHSAYQPYYFDDLPPFPPWDPQNTTTSSIRSSKSGIPLPEELSHFITIPAPAPESTSLWDLDINADSTPFHNNDARTTLTPIVGSVQFSPHLRNSSTFRPQFNLGAGMLLQTIETPGADGRVRNEYIPLLRAGIGAEWRPLDQLRIHFRYEYSHLTNASSLNPTLPEREHSLQTGVEIKF